MLICHSSKGIYFFSSPPRLFPQLLFCVNKQPPVSFGLFSTVFSMSDIGKCRSFEIFPDPLPFPSFSTMLFSFPHPPFYLSTPSHPWNGSPQDDPARCVEEKKSLLDISSSDLSPLSPPHSPASMNFLSFLLCPPSPHPRNDC